MIVSLPILSIRSLDMPIASQMHKRLRYFTMGNALVVPLVKAMGKRISALAEDEQTIENPALHLAVHMSMILSLREGEILGLQPSDLDFDAADGRGTISVNKALQRADKVALSKIDPTQIYHTFPDRREGSKSSLILKRTKTKKSNRILYMTKPLKEELLAWLEKMKQDEQSAPEKYSNCGQLFRLPDGLPIAPDVLTKWYRMWRAEHPEFEKIVFHGLRHPYVKHTTKKYNSEKQKTQATKIDLIAWVFRFCIFNYSKRSWTL